VDLHGEWGVGEQLASSCRYVKLVAESELRESWKMEVESEYKSLSAGTGGGAGITAERVERSLIQERDSQLFAGANG
jgi:hypothetical protein